MSPDGRIYTFGPFRFDPELRTLTREGIPVRLTPKAVELLETFLTAPGVVFAKDELLKRVWPGTFVEEGSLGFYINRLRHALGDEAAKPQYIQTVPRRGYRFVAPVQTVERRLHDSLPQDSPEAQAPAAEPALSQIDALRPPDVGVPVARAARRRRTPLLIAAAAVISLSIWTVVLAHRSPPNLYVTGMKRLSFDEQTKSTVLLRFDDQRVIVPGGFRQLLYWVDGTGRSEQSPFEPFHLIDVARDRQEALAIRRPDPGGDRGLWIVSLKGASPVRVGAVQTNGIAAWSHDRRWIAFTDGRTLKVTDTAGITVRTLETFTGNPDLPRWSPDDRLIRVPVGMAADRRHWHTLVDVRVDGSGTREVLADSRHTLNPTAGDWLTASDYMFCASPDDDGSCELWELSQRGGILPRQSALLRKVSSISIGSGSIVISADGRRMYAVIHSPSRLSRYDEARHRFVPYLGGVPALTVRFAPDAAWVVYITTDHRLWRADADGSHARALTTPPFTVDACAISPDGRWIAVRGGTGHHKIFLLPAEGGALQAIAPGDIEQGSPTWSPDGTRIAFGDVPETFQTPTGTERIHIYDRRTGHIEDVPGSDGLWSSRWSPDGRFSHGPRSLRSDY